MIRTKHIFVLLLMWVLVPGPGFPEQACARQITQETGSQALEGEMYQRALRFAVDQYNRAVEYGSSAQKIPNPSERRSDYEEMLRAINDAMRFYKVMKDSHEVYERIPLLLTRFWALEHNAGVGVLKDDSLRNAVADPEATAMVHFENAILIQPDSAVTYVAFATILHEMDDIPGSIAMYEKAIGRMEEPGIEHYRDLIDLYFTSGRHDEAAELAARARKAYPGEMVFVEFLTEMHLQAGETEQATKLLRELADMDPEHPEYRMLLGSEIYRQAMDHFAQAHELHKQIWSLEEQIGEAGETGREELLSRAEELFSRAEQTGNEALRLGELAVSDLMKASKLNPENDLLFHILGSIYQNKAIHFLDRRDTTDRILEAIGYDGKARAALEKARDKYEKAAGMDPGNPEYWESLVWIYTELDIPDKARQAMEKAGH